jgi:hypothetical protein
MKSIENKRIARIDARTKLNGQSGPLLANIREATGSIENLHLGEIKRDAETTEGFLTD